MHAAPDLSPAIQQYLLRYNNLVRQTAARHGLSDDDIDEVFQDVRIRLWRALQRREKSDEIPASYIYRTAVSAALDLIRRRRARREQRLEAVPNREVVTEPRSERSLVSSELVDQVAAAVAALTPSRRPVVRMHLAGYHRDEIAASLGWTEAKTRNLLYRGLEELRTRLTERGIGPLEVAK